MNEISWQILRRIWFVAGFVAMMALAMVDLNGNVIGLNETASLAAQILGVTVSTTGAIEIIVKDPGMWRVFGIAAIVIYALLYAPLVLPWIV